MVKQLGVPTVSMTLSSVDLRYKELKSIFSELHNLNPIQDGRQKKHSTSFSPVTSPNLRDSLHNFLTFSFVPFDTLQKFSRSYLVSV